METDNEQTIKEKKKAYMLEWRKKNADRYKCEHKNNIYRCSTCNGKSLCSHGISRYECVPCEGNGTCSHGKQKQCCVTCKGSSTCEHGRLKRQCRECDGSLFCEPHKIRKDRCVQCVGNSTCIHKKRKDNCKDCNLLSYLVNKQRANIKRVLQQSNQVKTKHSIEYLGCEVEYFMNFLKSKMTPEMNWDNIHLDHIKPVCAFDLNNPDEFNECCHYTNFQPLLANDNLIKSGKWNKIDDIFWNENIKGTEYLQLYIPE